MVGASPSTYSPVETGSEDLRETDADNELRSGPDLNVLNHSNILSCQSEARRTVDGFNRI